MIDLSFPLSTKTGLDRRRLLTLATAAPLAACAGAPDLRPYLSDDQLRRAILGSRNPLNETERAALLATLPPDLSADALQRQFVLQQALSESPLVTGNATTILRDGAETLPAMFDLLHRARNHINLEYYTFENVVWRGQSLFDLLLAKRRAGVVVNVIYDSFGSLDTPRELFDRLREAGARVLEFHPLDPLKAHTGWFPNDRDHRKIMLVDGKVAITGGVNMSKDYENPPSAGIPVDDDMHHAYWRDTAIRIEGPAVAELQKLFFATWTQQKGAPVAPARYFPPLPRVGVQSIRIIGSAPGDKRPLHYISLMTALLSAQQRAWLCSGYFVPPHQEREVFSRTARDGVDVRLVVPSHTDVQQAVYAARAAYGDMLERGVHIFELRNAVLHSKCATVDGVWSVVGSSNLDRRSVVFNNEVDAIVLGRDTASQLEAMLSKDMAASHEVTLGAWQDRSIAERWRELKAQLWEYWM